MKTAELVGDDLHYWTALAIGFEDLPVDVSDFGHPPFTLWKNHQGDDLLLNWYDPFTKDMLVVINVSGPNYDWRPSTIAEQGDQLIERFNIATVPANKAGTVWGASIVDDDDGWIDTVVEAMNAVGPTRLIAACRAIVAKKYGDEVLDRD